jgi:hypothetical protein
MPQRFANDFELALAAHPRFQNSPDAAKKTLDFAKIVFKILQWLRSIDIKSKDKRIIIPYGGGSVRRKTVTIPFSCEPIPVQKYSEIDINEDIDCDDNCILELNLIYQFKNSPFFGTTVSQLISYLQKGKSIICGLDIDKNNIYTTNKNNDNSSQEVIAIIDNFSENIGKDHHAISCIGSECIGNYIAFTFKDSYSYGTTIKRPGIFKVKVNQNMLYSLAPFGVGVIFGGDAPLNFLLSCELPQKQRLKIQKEINEKIKKCCFKWYCINNKCVQKFPDYPEVAELTPFETEAECNCDTDSDSDNDSSTGFCCVCVGPSYGYAVDLRNSEGDIGAYKPFAGTIPIGGWGGTITYKNDLNEEEEELAFIVKEPGLPPPVLAPNFSPVSASYNTGYQPCRFIEQLQNGVTIGGKTYVINGNDDNDYEYSSAWTLDDGNKKYSVCRNDCDQACCEQCREIDQSSIQTFSETANDPCGFFTSAVNKVCCEESQLYDENNLGSCLCEE